MKYRDWTQPQITELRSYRASTRGPGQIKRNRRPRFETLEDRRLLTATILHVNTFEDVLNFEDGRLSFREAIVKANREAGDFEIRLPAGTYPLTITGASENLAATGDLDILNNGRVTIIGASDGETTIDAAGLMDSTLGYGDRIFDVRPNATLILHHLTLINGSTPTGGPWEDGGAIRIASGTLEVSDSVLSDHVSRQGGAIYIATGNVLIADSTLNNNSASTGGAIYNEFGILEVVDSLFQSNAAVQGNGGAIWTSRSLSVDNSTFNGNSATRSSSTAGYWGSGGAIFVSHSVAATISRSRFEQNTALTNGGAVTTNSWNDTLSDDGVTISESVFSDNSAELGGAIHNSFVKLTITGAQFNDNRAADDGGGIYNSDATLLVLTSEFVGNAAYSGGAISNHRSDAEIVETEFRSNTARSGGAVENVSERWEEKPLTTLAFENSLFLGNSANDGGAIFNFGLIDVQSSRFTENTAERGGAIYSFATADRHSGSHSVTTVHSSTFSQNFASAEGGGIFANHLAPHHGELGSVKVEITDSLFEANAADNGGAIYSNSATVNIHGSQLIANVALTSGGALALYSHSSAAITYETLLTESLLADNSAGEDGGAIWNSQMTLLVSLSQLRGNRATNGGAVASQNFSNTVITNSVIAENEADNGGGIYNGAELKLRGSTMSGNAALEGGAIFHGGYDMLHVNHSTISGNTAVVAGGGISVPTSSFSELQHATIAFNSVSLAGLGGGVAYGLDGGWNPEGLSMSHTLILGNYVGQPGATSDLATSFALTGVNTYNLIGDANTAGGLQNGLNGNVIGRNGEGALTVSEIIEPLADNGGTTLTHALVFQSRAVDAGDPNFDPDASGSSQTTDQRGFTRIIGDRVDIGAFEFGATPTRSPRSLQFATPTVGRITASQPTQEWEFVGSSGQSTTIAVDPGAFDRALGMVEIELRSPSGNIAAVATSAFFGDEIVLHNIRLIDEGVYTVRVRAAARNRNPFGDYVITVAEVPTLQLGQPYTGQLSSGSRQYLKVTTVPGEPLQIDLSELPNAGAFELFVRRDTFPTRTQYDFAAAGNGSQEPSLYIANRDSIETLYIMLFTPTLSVPSASFALLAHIPEFAVSSTEFGDGGNAGDFTLHAVGTRFEAGVQLELSGADGVSKPFHLVRLTSGNELYATIDLRDILPGEYDVVFTNAHGEIVRVSRSLRVVETSLIAEQAVVPKLYVPAAVRFGFEYSFTVEWENRSPNDVAAPLITIASESEFGLQRRNASFGNGYTFLGVSDRAELKGILRPGERVSKTFFAMPKAVPTFYTSVNRTYKNLSQIFDWLGAVTEIAPVNMSNNEISSIANGFRELFGTTVAGHMGLLTVAANRTRGDASNHRALLQDEVLRVWSQSRSGIWGTVETEGSEFHKEWVVVATHLESEWQYTAVTDKNGHYHFFDLPDGEYQLSVDDFVISDPNPAQVTITQGQSVGEMDLLVHAAPVVDFQLYFHTGLAASHVFIQLSRADGDAVAFGIADAGGRLSLSEVEPGSYALDALLPNGWKRRLTEVVVPDDAVDVIEVKLASAIVRGSFPEGLSPNIAMINVANKSDIHFPFLSEAGFEAYLSAGTYSLFWFNDDGDSFLIDDNLVVQDGQILNIGEVLPPTADGPGFNGSGEGENSNAVAYRWFDENLIKENLFDGPTSLAAKWWMKQVLEDNDLPTASRIIRSEALMISNFVGALYGYEYRQVMRQYLTSAGPTQTQFRENHETVSFNSWRRQGFRNHGATTIWLNAVENDVKGTVKAVASMMACGTSQSLSLSEYFSRYFDLTGEQAFWVNHDGISVDASGSVGASFDDTLAGGVGYYGSPPSRQPDSRHIDGKVEIVRQKNGGYHAKLTDISFHVHDAFDIWPGSLSIIDTTSWYNQYGNAQTYATTIMAFLEFNAFAHDVVFDAKWKHNGALKTFKGDTDAPCDPCNVPNPPAFCKEDGPEEDDDDKQPVIVVLPLDPNDIIGPAGYGPLNHIVPDGLMPYTIRFENDPEEATAPAVIVTITQSLDTSLDWQSFRLGDMGFGDVIVGVPDHSIFFETRVDVVSSLGAFVDVVAGINLATGIATWTFTAIDPDTGELMTDPFGGFLPPNINAPEGDGFVTYSIRSKPGLVSGDRIDAEASIVFDVNDPIVTPPIFHTIDAAGPSSAVQELPAVLTTGEFEVMWGGEDDAGGSGIAFYDVFVSIDGGQWLPLLTRTTESQTMVSGEFGRSYAFMTLATDHVGHREVAKDAADAMTSVELPAWTNPVDPYDVDGDGEVAPLDALLVLVTIAHNGGSGPVLQFIHQGRFADVNGDGAIEPLDALLVLVWIARQQRQGEGENLYSTDLAASNQLQDPLHHADDAATPLDSLAVFNHIAPVGRQGDSEVLETLLPPSQQRGLRRSDDHEATQHSVDASLPPLVARFSATWSTATVDRALGQLDDLADNETSAGVEPETLENWLEVLAFDYVTT